MLAEEQAIELLFAELPQDTLVAAGAPGAVVSAQMQFVHVSSFYSNTAEGLYQEFVSTGVKAVYVDHYLSNINQDVWNLIEPQIGTHYQRIYSGNNGSIQVLTVLPQP